MEFLRLTSLSPSIRPYRQKMAPLKRRVETTPIVVSLPNCPIQSILFHQRALR
jgi:hypothetical protein